MTRKLLKELIITFQTYIDCGKVQFEDAIDSDKCLVTAMFDSKLHYSELEWQRIVTLYYKYEDLIHSALHPVEIEEIQEIEDFNNLRVEEYLDY